MALGVNVEKAPLLPMIRDAINEIFHNPKDAFWTGRVMDYLFDGIEIDCSSEETAAKAVCLNFDTDEAKAIERVREGVYKFSVFGTVSQFYVNINLIITYTIQNT